MVIKIENVSLKYRDAINKRGYLFKDINLEIQDKEFVCLLGPSGCGKSSLLGMIAGFVKPNSGQVLVNGKKVTRPDLTRTLVFQEYALFPWLNVIQNTAFGLKKLIADRQERYMVATRYLKMVGLLDHARDKISQLSGGMKQRVAIARALAVKPDLLLMDEPFGALDDKTRNEMQDLVTSIWRDFNSNIIFVTHSIDESLLLADRVIVFGKNSSDSDSVGAINADIRIDAPRPRELGSLNDYREQITSALGII